MIPKSSTVIDDSWYERPPDVAERSGAGGVVVRRAGDDVLVALVRENDHVNFILPKGGIREGEAAADAARREVEEEAGLRGLRLVASLGRRARLNFPKRRWSNTEYFLFITDQADGRPTDPHREYHLEWRPLQRLPDMFWPEQRELLESNRTMIMRFAREEA